MIWFHIKIPAQKVLKLLALFYTFLFYDRPFLHVCNLEENVLFSTLILGSVISDYVVFYGDVVLSASNRVLQTSYKARTHANSTRKIRFVYLCSRPTGTDSSRYLKGLIT